jgi:hypothetical protein
MPRWVKVVSVAGIVAVVLLIVLLSTGHGPSRHRGAAAYATHFAGS